MSIYTAMAKIIDDRGLTHGRLINTDGECCLLGARALALGESPHDLVLNSGDYYTIEGIEELALLCKDKRWPLLSRSPYVDDVYMYNDQELGSDKQLAFKLLEEAEAMRIKAKEA